MASDLFQFEWPVDQEGYFVERQGPRPTGDIATSGGEYDVIRPRGGPPRYYRPMEEEEHAGLWRQFATEVIGRETAIAFANKYGLLTDATPHNPPNTLDSFLNTAELVRQICDQLDAGDRASAADLFTRYAKPQLTAGVALNSGAAFEFRLIPRNLASALLLQAGQAITGNRQFRRCRNCTNWFRIGLGGHTERRKFCNDRCRVAWARHNKGSVTP